MPTAHFSGFPVFRHLGAYLICSQKSYSILLKHFDRVREVRVRIGHDIDTSLHIDLHRVTLVTPTVRVIAGNIAIDVAGGFGFPTTGSKCRGNLS
jgi:hypothetical protein